MGPDHYQFGGGSSATILHPLVLLTVVTASILMLTIRRRTSIPVFLVATFLIPAGQELLLGGVHIFVYRLIVLAGLLRLVGSKTHPTFANNWTLIDTAFFAGVICHAIAFTLLYREMGAAINQIGFIWDYLGGYTLLRYLIRDRRDIFVAIKCFAVLAVLFAVCMVREQVTGENIFGLLGGVRLYSEVREGHVRSQAVFQHAILAGTFGAILLPLFVGLWKTTRSRFMSAAGIVSVTIMVGTTGCSTPVLAYLAGLCGVLAWPLRRGIRWVRWGIVTMIVALSFAMNAPVWYVIAHVGIFSGSSVNHRAELLDTFMRHFGDWWLLGTASNATWGFLMFDTSNQYVQQGVTGGLLSLMLFIFTIWASFSQIGKLRAKMERHNSSDEWLVWLLGSCLFANMIAFFGISYFDQTRVAWFSILAIIAAAPAAYAIRSKAAGSRSPTLENRQSVQVPCGCGLGVVLDTVRRS